MKLRIFACMFVALAVALIVVPPAAGSAGDVTVTIFHTNDIHGRFEEDAYAGMGAAKIAAIAYIREMGTVAPEVEGRMSTLKASEMRPAK